MPYCAYYIMEHKKQLISPTLSLYLPLSPFLPLTHFSPHWVLRDGSSAFLNEVIVSEDEEVDESSGAGSSLGGGGNEILQCRVKSDGRDQVLLFNS